MEHIVYVQTTPANRGGQIGIGIYALGLNALYVGLIYCLGRTWPMVDVHFTVWFMAIVSVVMIGVDAFFVMMFISFCEHTTVISRPSPVVPLDQIWVRTSDSDEPEPVVTKETAPKLSPRTKRFIIGAVITLVGVGVGIAVAELTRSKKS